VSGLPRLKEPWISRGSLNEEIWISRRALAIALVARYIGTREGIFALCASAIPVGIFFRLMPRESSLGMAVGKTIGFSLLCVALCLLMRSLREAQTNRARLVAIVDNSNDAIVSLDLDGKVTSWNAAATQMYGYGPKEMIGRSILATIPAEFHEREKGVLRGLREGRRFDHFETEGLRKDGSRLKVSLTLSPLIDSRGQVKGASKIARDITERAKLQEAFIESEKLAATGRMAAAIAHEINNPLEAVTNLAYLIHTNESLNRSARDCSAMLMDEIQRISNVAKRSLTFFRDTGKPGEFDVAATLDAVLDLNNPMLAQKKIAVCRNCAGPYNIFGSSAEMRQVFSNLIHNAIDAAGSGGQIKANIRWTGRGLCRISIADNGHGILPDAKHRLFRPFVTTKQSTGNGLGLWISRGIVEKHGGYIRARSVGISGKSWTVFSVVLPCASVVAEEGGLLAEEVGALAAAASGGRLIQHHSVWRASASL
jgi:PAS domain S-box-containing protein